jgi:hypothetical protein
MSRSLILNTLQLSSSLLRCILVGRSSGRPTFLTTERCEDEYQKTC